MGDRPNPQTDVNVGTEQGSDSEQKLWKHRGGPFDVNLITSDVCLQCAACCKTTTKKEFPRKQYAVDYVEYGMAMWGYSEDKFQMQNDASIKNSKWVVLVTHNCVQLNKDNSCKLYERRPRMCKKYNCLWSSNIDKRLPQSWPIIKDLLKPLA